MDTVAYACVAMCLFVLGASIMTVALLQLGIGNRIKNRRLSELIWQARDRDITWWMDIDKKGQ